MHIAIVFSHFADSSFALIPHSLLKPSQFF